MLRVVMAVMRVCGPASIPVRDKAVLARRHGLADEIARRSAEQEPGHKRGPDPMDVNAAPCGGGFLARLPLRGLLAGHGSSLRKWRFDSLLLQNDARYSRCKEDGSRVPAVAVWPVDWPDVAFSGRKGLVFFRLCR